MNVAALRLFRRVTSHTAPMTSHPAPEPLHSFTCSGPLEMFGKLCWEYRSLIFLDRVKDLPERAYFAINGATTAWHLQEWVWHSATPAQLDALDLYAGRSVRTSKERQAWLREHRMLSFCDQIANGSKHMILDRKRDHAVATRERQFPLQDGQTTYYLMVTDSTAEVNVEDVIGFSLAFWKDLFIAVRLATIHELRASGYLG